MGRKESTKSSNRTTQLITHIFIISAGDKKITIRWLNMKAVVFFIHIKKIPCLYDKWVCDIFNGALKFY